MWQSTEYWIDLCNCVVTVIATWSKMASWNFKLEINVSWILEFLWFQKLQETVAWLHYVSFRLGYCGYIIQNTGCTLDVMYCLLLRKDHIAHLICSMEFMSCIDDTLQMAWSQLHVYNQELTLWLFEPSAFQCLTAIVMGQIMFYRKCGSLQLHSLITLAFRYTFPNLMLTNGEEAEGLNSSDYIYGWHNTVVQRRYKVSVHAMRLLTCWTLSVVLIESFRGSINFSSRFPPEKNQQKSVSVWKFDGQVILIKKYSVSLSVTFVISVYVVLLTYSIISMVIHKTEKFVTTVWLWI